MRTWLFALLVLGACASGNHIMTMQSFYDIPVGATKEEVVAQAGKPMRIRTDECGAEEYEYVERMKVGARLLQERRYIFKIENGKVTGKRMEQRSPPPTTFDSYEMQTTQNLPPSP